MPKKLSPEFENAERYDCNEGRAQLVHCDVREALLDGIERQSSKTEPLRAAIERIGELEVYAFGRKTVDPKFVRERFDDFVEDLLEDFMEEYGEPGEPVASLKLTTEAIAPICSQLEQVIVKLPVWQCEIVASETFEAAEILEELKSTIEYEESHA